MPHPIPDFETFRSLAKRGNLIPVYRRLLADQLTPVLAYRRIVRPDDRMATSFLLESVEGGARIGRYSFLGSRPMAELIARGHDVEYIDHAQPDNSRTWTSDDPLAEMDKVTANWKIVSHRDVAPAAAMVNDLPDFTGGWVGFAGYDTVRYLEGEKLPAPPPDDRHLPDLHFGLYRQVVAFDNVHKTVLAITHVLLEEHADIRDAYDAALADLDDLIDRIETPAPPLGKPLRRAGATGGSPASASTSSLQETSDQTSAAQTSPDNKRQSHTQGTGGQAASATRAPIRNPQSEIRNPELPVGEVDLHSPPPKLPAGNMGEGGYQNAVRKAKEYIKAGDIFQVVPSQRFELRTEADPFQIYRALRVVNPSPYMFYVQIAGGMLIGSSPEILCRVQRGQVVNRPLAGTRRRGRNDAEDQALEEELLADPKEIAEHVMLVDLGRNDVGRVAQPGTITLPAVLEVERYSHVMHISSTVVGQLRAGCTCWDALRVSLPVGTVSGAPKVRAMQIIDELEPTRRGPYAGAVGYADFAGNMDVAIALRTMVVTPAPRDDDASNASSPSWTVHIQVGAGIVADSVPDLEHTECVNKAAALAKAVDLAERAFV